MSSRSATDSGRRSADRALIESTRSRVQLPDRGAERAARAELDAKTKPRASLGRLEDLASRLASIRAEPQPGPLAAAVVVFAADHGVAAEGVSAYPQEVTGQMLRNIAGGGAAVCVLARQARARLVVVDVGVRDRCEDPAVLDRRVRAGTANSAAGPAMSRAEAERAIAVGIGLADELIDDGIGIVALGEMGIGNTTAASALTATLLRVGPGVVCGRGTGIDDETFERKRATVARALAANCVSPWDPIGAVAEVGGLEIAALVGVVLGAAARRTPVVVDGFITAAAALTAACLNESCAEVLIASHLSPEPGHGLILSVLGLEPLLDLELRLGEGSGAALALPIIAAAQAVLSEVATFESAAVTDSGA